ncbi:NAD(P)-binding domain-containing protein [Nesterenkonia lacusekhoensis]|uniref:Cation diffusion facilitator CzcD-associated flavoprotein CzcO n=1 Tax=Nesterenkonia lacusekhoensis TaxID=150832 RepID=A0ABS4T1R4_9MICC|nr:NAD(P)-binding domain-containing protein [Nesterenkonia lacusekhoensis]MBP2317813.1 cation diffusion facilitator CzcD-associated flavoprotein CzcO [Nesterenkonia lacusekhoensis]
MQPQHWADVVVIGVGQAGLSAGYHLRRSGLLSFVMLDAEAAPGGAWQHRWESLRMETVNGIFDLPGMSQPAIDPMEPSRTAVPRYFAQYEAAMELPILRPVKALRVQDAATPSPGEPSTDQRSTDGELEVRTDQGVWRTRAIINATGTWNNPLLPQYPGQESFTGWQLHTRDYRALEDFADRRVAVVGGGISALQQLEEISRVATSFWYTRREPVFHGEEFRPEVEGRATIEKVTAAAEAGEPTGSIVSYTGLGWSSYARAAHARGALQRREMFTAIEPCGLREADGSFTSADTILWATGFRPDLSHLEPLGLRNERGGIRISGTATTADPRVHLVGFGPSQSTVGANRAGRAAARALTARLGASGVGAAV